MSCPRVTCFADVVCVVGCDILVRIFHEKRLIHVRGVRICHKKIQLFLNAKIHCINLRNARNVNGL